MTPQSHYLRPGIHDHHLNAARTDEERERARRTPWQHYDDERCWWTTQPTHNAPGGAP